MIFKLKERYRRFFLLCLGGAFFHIPVWANECVSNINNDRVIAEHAYDIVYFNEKFLTVTTKGRVLIGTADSSWNVYEIEPNPRLVVGVATNGSSVVAVDRKGKVFRSESGKQWGLVHESPEIKFLGVESNGNEFVAIGRDHFGSVLLYSKGNGRAWARAFPDGVDPSNQFHLTVAGKSFYVSSHEFLYKSNNGSSWVKVNASGQEIIGLFAENNGMYINVTRKGIHASKDGVKWKTVYVEDPPLDVRRVKWLKDSFLLVGGCGNILRSMNGDVWEKVNSGSDVDRITKHFKLTDVVANDSMFLAVGESMIPSVNGSSIVVLKSYTGKNWEDISETLTLSLKEFLNSKNKTAITKKEN